jgi:hypothetical protein
LDDDGVVEPDLSMLPSVWKPPDDPSYFETELARECSPAHVLYGVTGGAIARCRACDDCLFSIDLPGAAWALMHLTYARTAPEPNPRVPSTLLARGWVEAVGIARARHDYDD